MARYGNNELTDMVFIYAQCERNERQAAALYAARFPERRHPHYSIFRQLEQRMRRYGSLHAPNLNINVRHRNQETVNAVRMAVLDNPHTSTRAVARELQINYTTVHRIIKKNLKMQPYKRHTSQLLHQEDFLRREAFCNWISEQVDIDNIDNDTFLRQILWTDECTFHSDGRVNRHNEHHYAVENPHCRKDIHVQGRFAVNVWMGIVDQYIIGPHFCETINAESYSAFLQDNLPELLEDVPLDIRQRIIYQQDGHPAHTSYLARTHLNHTFPNRWIGIRSPLFEWPPRSPDMTPMDYFLWGYLKEKIYSTLPRNREDLIDRIQQTSATITPVMLAKVRENFMRRVAICLENNGGYFEHLL